MLVDEALEILGIQPGASKPQIKQAYRDMVKVWHPDRLGDDDRLRRKAEEKLRNINHAYKVLLDADELASLKAQKAAVEEALAQNSFVRRPRNSANAASSSSGGFVFRRYRTVRSEPTAEAGGSRGKVPRRRIQIRAQWVYGFVIAAVVIFAGALILKSRIQSRDRDPGEFVKSAEVTTPEIAPTEHRGRSRGKRGSRPQGIVNSVQPVGEVEQPAKMTEAQVKRVNDRCEDQEELHGEGGYQTCIQAQLDLIAERWGQVNLSAMNAAERESIESVCAVAKRDNGKDAYDHCLTTQMAEWAAETARPDTSRLTSNERASVTKACEGAKDNQGPAAYDRCLGESMKALSEMK